MEKLKNFTNNRNGGFIQRNRLRKALIMAGGFGSRMGNLTKNIPKPMLPLQGKPILEYSIDLCKKHGITDIAISVFYFKEKIKEYFGDGSRFGVNITYIEEETPLGTAGAIRLSKDWLTEPFMMCNADELKDVNLQKMYQQHLETGAAATLALTFAEDPSKYGVAEQNGFKILSFVEKPKKEEAPSNWINAGLYIINPEIVEMVSSGFCMVEKDIFPKLASQGRLFGFKFNGQWLDTGTPERYITAQQSWHGFEENLLQVPKEESKIILTLNYR